MKSLAKGLLIICAFAAAVTVIYLISVLSEPKPVHRASPAEKREILDIEARGAYDYPWITYDEEE